MEEAPRSPAIRPSIFESATFLVCAGLLVAFTAFCWIATEAWHYTMPQVLEMTIYGLIALAVPCTALGLWLTRHSHLEDRKIHPPVTIPPTKDQEAVKSAWEREAIVLGYDILGEPFLWPDEVRTQQCIVLGMTGSGKSTLIKNVISQDLARRSREGHKIPIIIFDGKGDVGFFLDLLPHVIAAERLGDLRLINPALPELSSRYNPFHANAGADQYVERVSMVFGSFDLGDDFFAKHQLNYLADLVRVLHYAGLPFNFHDVLVAALDEEVLREQIAKARSRLELSCDVPGQHRLNFEMSARNLQQSLTDRERVPKIQGLLNECMTFLGDELSIITGPYQDLLSIEEVLRDELILFVSLNINRNTDAVRALGKMLLQDLQLTIGRRYEDEGERRNSARALCSVVLDEFAPFGYDRFAQILQTARGTNTAFLFSMQSLPQLLRVGKGFKDDVTSAPATKLLLNTHDEETARYFIRASAETTVRKRTLGLIRDQFLGWERFSKGTNATERDETEYRAQDERIKNMPKGQVQVLMTDATRGTIHTHLHVRAPAEVALPGRQYALLPRLKQSSAGVVGANLRFKNSSLEETYGRRFAQRRRNSA